MGKERVEEFLDLYKKLEQLLKVNFSSDSGKYESVVARYENSKASGRQKNAIAAIREIRNLLQHNPKLDGSYIAEPSDEVLKALREVIHSIVKPKLAIDFGVKEDKIYKTYMDYNLPKVLRHMNERGYSHVPVIEKGKLAGVLSTYSVFDFVVKKGLNSLTEDMQVSAMRDFISIESQRNEYYLFMPKNATFVDADEAFEKRDGSGRRLVVIFITEHGRTDEAILAMLTPWSVVGK